MFHLYDGVQEHDPRFLGDDLFSRVMMLYELWDGGEASAFKSVLILQTKRGKMKSESSVNKTKYNIIFFS